MNGNGVPGIGHPGLWIAVCFHLLCLLIAVYDAYVVIRAPEGLHTVSFWLVAWSKQYPVLTLATGFVIGHLFFPFSGR